MGEELIIDKELLKAIGTETRISILKSLSDHQKTQTDLAKELNLSSPTVLEHLDHLVSAGLVEKIEEGRKWKYYILTPKGKKLMSSSKKSVPLNALIVLGVLLLFVVVIFVDNPFVQEISAIQSQDSEETSDDSFSDSQEIGEKPSTEPLISGSGDSFDENTESSVIPTGEDFDANKNETNKTEENLGNQSP